MEIMQNVVLLAHFMGWAALFGGMLVQARHEEKLVNGPMRDGIGTAVVAGLALVGFLEAGDDAVDHAKVGVKLAVGLVILILVMANLRKPRIPDNLFWTILGLTVVNMAVAVLWQ
jgi:peptidoglycan/LPS O-acetylase OafA/YrhL